MSAGKVAVMILSQVGRAVTEPVVSRENCAEYLGEFVGLLSRI